MFSVNLALTYGAVASTAAGAFLASNGEVAAPAALGVVAVAFLAVRLSRAGVNVLGCLPSRRRVGTGAVAFLLISSATLGGLGGPASPVGTADAAVSDCTWEDALIGLWAVINPEDSCGIHNEPKDTAPLDLYQSGQSLDASNDGYLTAQENYGTDLRSIAWSKAKLEIVRGLNNNNTSAVVSGEANETVRDYYSLQQKNLVEQWNSGVATMNYSFQANQSSLRLQMESLTLQGFFTYNATLANGSEVSVRGIAYTTEGGSDRIAGAIAPASGGFQDQPVESRRNLPDGHNLSGTDRQLMEIDGSFDDGAYKPTYVAPSQDYQNITPANAQRYRGAFGDRSNQSAQITANIGPYAEKVYSQYEAGELDTSNLLDAGVLAGESATDYNSSGYYDFAAVGLASLGYASDMNSSFTVSYNNTTADGYLFYTGDDVSEFSVGTTYNSSEYNATAYLVQQQNDSARIVNLNEAENGTWTVENITNVKNGEEMQNTTVVKKVYQTHNASQLAEELEKLQELRQEWEEANEPAASGGGSGSSGSILNQLAAFLGVSVGVAGLVVIGGVLLAIKIYTP